MPKTIDPRIRPRIQLPLLLLLCTGCPSPPLAPPPAADAAIPPSPDLHMPDPVSVLQHHKDPSRDGLYIDAALSRAAVRGFHLDAGFSAPTQGVTYAQPLFLAGSRDLVYAVTEQDLVYAFDAYTGAVAWQRSLGTPAPLGQVRCGIVPLGITGTPVIDPQTRTLYLDAVITPDGGQTRKHLIHALSADDGSSRPGWPVDVAARVPGFNPETQNQRGGLLLLQGTLYVPYGAHANDCGDYHGWVVGVPLANPAAPRAWSTSAHGGGVWGPAGLSTEGRSIFAATGNTGNTDTWGGGEAVLRLQPGPSFSGQAKDFFTPSNWKELDDKDLDLGGSATVLFSVPGATPSALVAALGKDGKLYLLDQGNLGGIGGAVAVSAVSNGGIIGAATAYTTAQGTYLVFAGTSLGCPAGQGRGNLVALRISASAPPQITVAWCADQHGSGSPIATTTDGRSEAVVWAAGADGDNALHAVDGDTGQALYDSQPLSEHVRHWQVPIAARGRIYLAADNRVYAFANK